MMKSIKFQVPAKERMCKGAVVIIECPEEIACDPCGSICKHNAISLNSVNSVPEIDFEKCRGCGLCVQFCPGLAIFMAAYNKDKAYVTIPYEYLPIPMKEQIVTVLNRDGTVICKGRVTNIVNREKSIGDTPTVTIEVPEEFAMDARDIMVDRVE